MKVLLFCVVMFLAGANCIAWANGTEIPPPSTCPPPGDKSVPGMIPGINEMVDLLQKQRDAILELSANFKALEQRVDKLERSRK